MRPSRLAAAATTLIVAAALAACSSSTDSGTSGGPVTLSYGLWNKTQVEAPEKVIDAFHTKNPDVSVKVQLTPYAEYFTKLQAAATGGETPDVFWMNGPNFQLYAANGMLAPLSDLGADTAAYPESLVDLYTYE